MVVQPDMTSFMEPGSIEARQVKVLLTKVFDEVHRALWERKKVEAFEEARAAVRAEVESILQLAESIASSDIPPDRGRKRQLLYNMKEAAQQLGGITTRTVHSLLTSGELESVKLGSRRMIPGESLEAYVEKLRGAAERRSGGRDQVPLSRRTMN